MSDFVRDDLAAPGGKSDARPNTDPPQKSYTAAEWNLICAALASLRTRVKLDVIHVDDLGAKGDDTFEGNPSATDDTDAIQRAINAAQAIGATVKFTPGKIYRTTAELLITGGKVIRLYGGNGIDCSIRCTGNVRSVIACVSGVCIIDGFRLNCTRAAKYGLYLEDSSGSQIGASAPVEFYAPLIDGLHIEGVTDEIHVGRGRAQICGKIFHTTGFASGAPVALRSPVTGTVAITNGTNPVLTRDSGTVDFSALGIRAGDPISIHASAPGGAVAAGVEWYTAASAPGWVASTPYGPGDIVVNGGRVYVCTASTGNSGSSGGPTGTGSAITDGSVTWAYVYDGDAKITSTKIYLTTLASPSARSGLQFSIHVGDGYHEGPGRADNNINQIGLFRATNCAGFGMRFNGLYGPEVGIAHCDGNSFPIAIGTSCLGTYGSAFSRVYFEANNAADNFMLGVAGDVVVDVGTPTGDPYILTPSVWGFQDGMLNLDSPGQRRPFGNIEIDYVPTAKLIDGVYSPGRIVGQNYTQNGPSAYSGLTIKDAFGRAWAAVSGVEGLGVDANAVGFDFDCKPWDGHTIAQGPTKHLAQYRKNSTAKFAVGFEGDVRQPHTTSSAGAATIDKPKGRSAIALGASSVTITNALCVAATTQVVITPRAKDATGTNPIAIAADGSFTVTVDANCTADLPFDWHLVNAI